MRATLESRASPALTDGVSVRAVADEAAPAAKLSGTGDRGGTQPPTHSAEEPVCLTATTSSGRACTPLHVAAGRPDGAVRRLRDAGPLRPGPVAEHQHTPDRRRALRRQPHGHRRPARPRRGRARWRRWCRRPSPTWRRAAAVHPAHQRRRRRHRRPDGRRRRRRPAVARGQRLAARRTTSSTSAPASPPSIAVRAPARPRPRSPSRARADRRRRGPARPGGGRLVFMQTAGRDAGRRSGRPQPLRLHRRGRLRDRRGRRPGTPSWPRPCWPSPR